MKGIPDTVLNLIDYFKQFPSIGEKSAFRMVLFLINQPPEFQENFGKTVQSLKENISLCPRCFHLSEKGKLCTVCSDPMRDKTKLCVVSTVPDLLAIESTDEYDGKYFVLHGLLSPIKGVGYNELHLSKLLEIVKEDEVKEVIIATDYSVEGDATALYIARLLKEYDVKISRIASGVPSGGSLEYLDSRTIQNALKERKSFYFEN